MKRLLEKTVHYCTHLSFFLMVFFYVFIFSSCTVETSQKSFISSLDKVDALISQGLFKEAKEELIPLEKKAYDIWFSLGIYKRYVKILENNRAEKLLLKTLKKNSKNLELNAVYTSFLLKNKRINEALSYGKILQNTKYGSIYSQAVLQNVIDNSNQNILSVFNKDYYSVYYDAYKGTNESSWLINCAVLDLVLGNYVKASSICPENCEDYKSAYFWSLVLFDAKNYTACIRYCDLALNLINYSSYIIKEKFPLSNLIGIQSDSYYCIQDIDKAEFSRRNFIDSIINDKNFNQFNSKVIPVLLVNSSLWSKGNKDYERARNLLLFTLDNWKDFVPALICYADLSYETSLERIEDFGQLTLRDRGLATLEMEKYDNRIIIPLSDAIYRVDEALLRLNDPRLFLLQLDLKYKNKKEYLYKEKKADLWNMLEKSSKEELYYSDVLLSYSLNFLLNNNEFEEAKNLFKSHLIKKYNIDNFNLYEDIAKKVNSFNRCESEFASYFSVLDKKLNETLFLHERLVFEQNSEYISSLVSDITVINLSMIYSSLGKNTKAIDLYSKVVSRSCDDKLKSLVMYRLSNIYNDLGDKNKAIHCAEYAVSLDNRNESAKLFLNKLRLD